MALAIPNGKSCLLSVDLSSGKVVLRYNNGPPIRLHMDTAVSLAMRIIYLHGTITYDESDD